MRRKRRKKRREREREREKEKMEKIIERSFLGRRPPLKPYSSTQSHRKTP